MKSPLDTLTYFVDATYVMRRAFRTLEESERDLLDPALSWEGRLACKAAIAHARYTLFTVFAELEDAMAVAKRDHGIEPDPGGLQTESCKK